MSLIKKLLPHGKRNFLANALDQTGINRLLRFGNTWAGLVVMNYHRIGHPEETPFDRNLFSASAEAFEKQLRFIKKNADLVTLKDLETVFSSSRGKHILITFDDGYRDNYELAFPILKSNDASAVFFIPTSYIDTPRVAWWDEIAWMLQNAKVDCLPAGQWFEEPLVLGEGYPSEAIGKVVRKYWSLQGSETENFLNDLAVSTGAGRAESSLAESLWMTWEMIQEMEQAGMEFGGHTETHPVLAKADSEKQQQEIANGYNRLAEKLQHAPTAFSYPVGQAHMFTEETKKIVRETGFQWAFSFYGNHCKPGPTDLMDIPRCAVEYNLPSAIFRSRLTLPQIFAKN